jgi:hypothetical protein
MNISRDVVDLDWGIPYVDAVESYEVYLGDNLGGMQKVATMYFPCATVFHSTSLLESGKTYYWQIVAVGSCGGKASDVWSFITTP